MHAHKRYGAHDMTEFSTTVSGVPELALRWHRAGQGAVLATVVETWGSAPRRAGAQMVVSGDGQHEGSVSGGCVEGAVMTEALEALADQNCRMLEFGVSDGDAFAVGLACGGTIRVLLEPVGAVMPEATLADLVQARAARQDVAYVFDLATERGTLVSKGDGPQPFDQRFRLDRSGLENENTFVCIHNAPLRVVIVGAVHIAQAFVPMARIAGFDPVIIDPRTAFASAERFQGERIITEWPQDALADLNLDARTACVLLTHDPKLDDPALHIVLRSDVFYIGALGSKKTHAARRARLENAGFSDQDIDRIFGPIGLSIGAASPAEIAVSILAQLVEVLRKG